LDRFVEQLNKNQIKRGTEMVKSNQRLFYGWYIVIAGFVITGAAIGFYNNCLGVFVKPVCDALGFSRGEFTMYQTVSTLTSMLVMPLFGELYRKVSLKKILLLGAVGCGVIPLGYSLSTHIWQFYVLAFFNGLLFNAASMMTVGTIVNNWFISKRGTASGIAFAGSGLFAAAMVPLASWVIAQYGWQWGYRLIGIAGILVLLPVIILVIKDKPEEIGLTPYIESTTLAESRSAYQPTGLTRDQAMKTPAFWFLMLGVFFCGFTTMGVQPHTISYLSDIGYDYGFASTIVSALMLSMIVGKLSLGYLFDKVGSLKGSLAGSFAAFIAVASILVARSSVAAIWLYAFAIGFACSTGTVAVNYLTAIYFGDKDFSRILPLTSMAATLGISIATPLSGAIYDILGSYEPAWYMYLVTAALEILFLVLAYRSGSRLTYPKEELH